MDCKTKIKELRESIRKELRKKPLLRQLSHNGFF